MRKIISILMVFCAVLGWHMFNVSAEMPREEQSSELNIVMLEALGIDVSSDQPLTKGEYADWIVKITATGHLEGAISFSDVTAKYTYYSSVAAAVNAGYFSGNGSNVFGKDNELTYANALVPLVRLAGYEIYAQKNGGYPNGYLTAATQADFGVKCENSDSITRSEAAKLCADVLDVSMNMAKIDGSGYEKSNETVLSYYHDIYKGKGYMNANRYTNLYTEQGYREDCIQIDKKQYINRSTDFDGYLGYNIDFYYQEKDNDDPFMWAAAPSHNVKVKTIQASADNAIEDNQYEYYEEQGQKKTIKLAKGYNQVINNGNEFEIKNENLIYETGELTFIDSDSDGYYETVICTKPESMVIEGISMYNEEIFTSSGTVSFDSFDKTGYVALHKVDENGNIADAVLDDLKTDEVLTVYRSADGKYLEAYATENKIKGKLVKVSGDEVQIDTITYKFLNNAADEIRAGSVINAYVDYLGYVVKITEVDSGYQYGYVYSCGYDDANEAVTLRIFTSLKLEIYTTENKIILDGKKITAEQAGNDSRLFLNGAGIKQVIRYRMRNGKIYIIDTVAEGSGGENDKLVCNHTREVMKYSPNFPTVNERYKVTDSTLFLIVPELDEEKTDLTCYSYTYPFKDYPQQYTFSVYDVDDELKAGAVIMYPSGSRKNGTEPLVNGKCGIIYRISDVVNEDGDIVKEVKMYTEQNKIETFYTKTDMYTDFDASFGTVVLYVVEGGKLTGIKTEFIPDLNDPKANKQSSMSFTDEWTAYFGQTKDVFSDYFTINTNYSGVWDDSVNNMRIVPLDCQQNIVVSMADRKITEGSRSNLYRLSYEYVRIFRGQTIRQLVIYEY